MAEAKRRTTYILIAAVLFSVSYWIAASYKPFHVDEFYSWVYAQRCTFKEILTLKEFGIGHPPLYHLVQKLVQNMFSFYHPLQVRLANYLFGLCFVMLLLRFLFAYAYIPLLAYGIALSAAVLDTFIFSRMWGLVCLFSLFLLQAGQKYAQSHSLKDLALVFLVFAVGIASDYNFVLLAPYVLIIIIQGKKYSEKLLNIGLILSGILWLVLEYLKAAKNGNAVSGFLYNIVYNPIKLSFEIVNLVFNFWYLEIFLLAMASIIVFGIFLAKTTEDGRSALKEKMLPVLIISIGAFLYSLCFIGIFRIRTITVMIIVSAVALFYKSRNMRLRSLDAESKKILTAITGGMILLLIFNIVSWVEITERRFIILFYPLIIFYLINNFNKKMVKFISIIFMITGLLYVFSFGISHSYAPPALAGMSTAVFQDVEAYSTRHLVVNSAGADEPYILDFYIFNKSCKLCKIGTDDIPLNNFNTLWVIAKSNFVYSKSIPAGFKLTDKILYLSSIDKLMFRYFKPFNTDYYCIFKFEKDG